MGLRAIVKLSEHRPTGLLYHYTTMVGALGIISCKKIWATHIKREFDVSWFHSAMTSPWTMFREGSFGNKV